MIFQTLDYKKNHFFNLLDDNYLLIKLSYIKGSVWLKLIGHSDSLYIKVTKAITNHVSIGKYCLRFFLKEDLKCLCRTYLIKSRYYIFHNRLGDEQTCRTTLASAYVLRCLSAAWSQLQMMGRSPRWK